MSDNNTTINELDEKIADIKQDINDIQGDMSVLALLEKKDRGEMLRDVFNSRFGRSKQKRRVWYYANGERTMEEISDVSGVPRGSVDRCAPQLCRDGMLAKTERDGRVYYSKKPMTTGVGLEAEIEETIDDL